MIWVAMFVFLFVALIAAMAWKPKKPQGSAQAGNGLPANSGLFAAISAPVSSREQQLSEDIEFVAQAIREADFDARKQAALEKASALIGVKSGAKAK